MEANQPSSWHPRWICRRLDFWLVGNMARRHIMAFLGAVILVGLTALSRATEVPVRPEARVIDGKSRWACAPDYLRSGLFAPVVLKPIQRSLRRRSTTPLTSMFLLVCHHLSGLDFRNYRPHILCAPANRRLGAGTEPLPLLRLL
jgi:hypothetical protein